MAHTARELGINPNTLYIWINKYSKAPNAHGSKIHSDNRAYDQIMKLTKELARVTQEQWYIKKSNGILCKIAPVKYTWIKKSSNAFFIASMCRILNVPRSGYYEWTNNSRSNRAEQDKKLIAMIRTICKEGLWYQAY